MTNGGQAKPFTVYRPKNVGMNFKTSWFEREADEPNTGQGCYPCRVEGGEVFFTLDGPRAKPRTNALQLRRNMRPTIL